MRHLICSLVLLMALLCVPGFAYADELRHLPEVGTLQKAEPQPTKPMYTYRDGQQVELTQDFGFVAFRFKEGHPSREQRHAFYARVRLVVSEIQEPALLSEGFYALRLVPGATEAQWNLFAAQLRQSPELTYVGRVFSQRREDGLMDLLVSTPRLSIRWKGPVAREAMRRVEAQYPLVLERVEEDGQGALFTLRDLRLDTVELANTLFRTGQFATVEAVFITVAGQPLTPDVTRRVMEGAMDAMPEDMRRQLMQKAADQAQRQAVPAEKPRED